jgi:hypothetical protein
VPTWAEISGKPTTLAGYGITNAMSTAHPANAITNTNINNWNTAFGWGNHATQGYVSQTGLATGDIPLWNGTSMGKSSISATGSTATISGSPFLLSNSSQLTIDNPGGTIFPFSNEARIQWVTSGTQKGVLYTSGDNLSLQASTGNLNLRAGGSDRLIVGSNGKIGIGAAPDVSSTVTVDKSEAGFSGGAISAITSYVGNSDLVGVRANSVPNPGWGYGVYSTGGFMGVRGSAAATTYTGTAYGVYGVATGSAGTRVGVYGTASGGTTNWAGYFQGNEYISGDLRVGTLNGATGYKVSVNGKIMCTELRVLAVANWPDYVFGDSHKRLSLDELGTFVKTEKHLPGVPSAAEMEAAQGFEVGEMQKITIEKVEELTLYILEQHERIKAQDEAAKEQEARLKKQEQDIENLKALVQQLLND